MFNDNKLLVALIRALGFVPRYKLRFRGLVGHEISNTQPGSLSSKIGTRARVGHSLSPRQIAPRATPLSLELRMDTLLALSDSESGIGIKRLLTDRLPC